MDNSFKNLADVLGKQRLIAATAASPLLQSCFIMFLCFVLYLIGPISLYETNDDVYYTLIFSGQLLTDIPIPHAGTINYVLSLFFIFFYRIFPDLPCYGLFHIAVILLSLFFLNYCYAAARNNRNFFARLIVSLLCTLPLLFYIQFTKTSFVAGIAGYLALYLLTDCPGQKHRQKIVVYSSAVLFLVLSFALRKESFVMATIVCGVPIACMVLTRQRHVIISLSTAALAIMLLSMIHFINDGEEWRIPAENWSKVIGAIIDYDRFNYEPNRNVFSHVGWSPNDYNFLLLWGYADEKIYGKPQIDYIFKNARRTDKNIDNTRTALQSAISFPARNYILSAIGATFVLFLAYQRQRRRYWIMVIASILVCVLILSLQGRFPTRISIALAFFLPWAALIFSGEPHKQLFYKIVAAAVLLLTIIPVYGQYKDLSRLEQRYLSANRDLKRFGSSLNAANPVNLITFGTDFPYVGILPLEQPRYLSGARFIWLCSMNQNPIQKRQIALCLRDDIYRSLVTNPATFVVIKPQDIGVLQRYIWEHYQIKTIVNPVYVTSNFAVFKLIKA